MQLSQGYNQSPYRGTYPFTMTVEGEAQLKVNPDQATITLGVVTENENAQIAQDENAALSNSVILALKQFGIDENEITTTIYTVNPRYDYIEGKSILRGYEVEHHFEVLIRNLSTIGLIYDTAIQHGANRSGLIQFHVSEQAAYYREALRMAVHNAQRKAAEIAKTIGAVLNSMPVKITELVDQPISPFPVLSASTAASTKSEAPPIQSGALTIQARIKMVYSYYG